MDPSIDQLSDGAVYVDVKFLNRGEVCRIMRNQRENAERQAAARAASDEAEKSMPENESEREEYILSLID